MPNTSVASQQDEVNVIEDTVAGPAELNQNILNILGSKLSEEKILGSDIHPDISCRWEAILKKGLPAELKSELIKKYPAPSNCTAMEAPELNPEIKAALNQTRIERDNRFILFQKQLGACLSALSYALSSLIGKDEEGVISLMEQISDASRLIADLHFSESNVRRYFISENLNPSVKNTLSDAPIDGFLFGNNLEERVKSAQSLEKTSISLKPKTSAIKGPRTSLNSKSLPVQRFRQQPTGTSRTSRQESRTSRPRQPPTPQKSRAKRQSYYRRSRH